MKQSYMVIGLFFMISSHAMGISNPFAKDALDRWKNLNAALNAYFTQAMTVMDSYAMKQKSSKKDDLIKQFKDVQKAFAVFKDEARKDPKKLKSGRSMIEQNIVLLENQISELKLVESLLLRRSAGLYDQLKATYETNEQKMPASIRVTSDKVYPFLSFTPDEGPSKSLDEVRNALKIMKGTMGGDTRERDSLFRQLEFYFQHAYAKQEFDAFLKGKSAVKALELSKDDIVFIQNRFMEIPEIVDMLADVKEFIK